MSDLIKLGHKILSEKHPDLEARFHQLDYLLGELVFAHRMNNGLTQDELADLCNVSLKTIHQVEGGMSNITIATYMRLFDKLEISVQDVGEYLIRKSRT